MDLLAGLPTCTQCALCEGRTHVVVGRGNPRAALLFIGEAPGEQEDKQGRPFVGRAGKLLDRLLGSLGLTEHDYYITNVNKCRPPGNRPPKADEIRACTPYLVEQIRRMRPAVIVTLGNAATKFLLAGLDPARMKVMPPIGAARGQPHTLDAQGLHLTVFPLYHPAATLHNPPLRADLEADMRALKALLESRKR